MRPCLLISVSCLLAGTVLPAAPVYSSREDALTRAFPPRAKIERRSFFLTEPERKRAAEFARAEVPSALVVAYAAAARDGAPLGTAYFDTHTVRTLPETLLVVVAPDGNAVERVEVLAFGEPEDYLPRPAWLKLFGGKSLDAELAPGRGLAHVTGATLTTRAIAAAVRRVLAIHRIVSARERG